MAVAKTGSNKSKNPQKVRMLNGKLVKMCLYNGRAVDHGKYYAAEVDGQLVLDETGKPRPYHSTGELVWQ